MILPTTFTAALLLMILSAIAWGSWPSLTKLTGKWRFELFYYDFAVGAVLATVAAGLTFGSMGSELSMADNLSVARIRFIVLALLAGMIFNLGNMLFLGVVSIAGMSIAYPISLGLGLAIGACLINALHHSNTVGWVFSGAGVALVAVVATAIAFKARETQRAILRKAEKAQAALNPSAIPAPAPEDGAGPSPTAIAAKTARKKPKPAARPGVPSFTKGLLLAVFSGLLIGPFVPLVELSRLGDFGLGPYAAAFLVAGGILLSTLIYNLIFLNLPVQGPPIEMRDYFRGSLPQHLIGLGAGLVWGVGTLANFVAASAPAASASGPLLSYAASFGAGPIGALWGFLAWKEFANSGSKARILFFAALLLLVLAVFLIARAPVLIQQ